MALKLNLKGFHIIELEGLKIPFNICFTKFLLINLSEKGSLLGFEKQINYEEIRKIYHFLKNNPNIDSITEKELPFILQNEYPESKLKFDK